MGLAVVALVLLVAYVAYRVARHRRDARLRTRLDSVLHASFERTSAASGSW